MEKSGKKAFIPFIKPWRDGERCERWINACSRENFSAKNVNKSTYICALHWPREKGPTEKFPDPLKANLTTKEVEKACRKRKEPKQRLRDAKPCIKKARNQSDSFSTSFLSTSNDVFDDAEEEINEDDLKLENCKATQTDMKHELARELANRVDRIISNNQLKVPTETLRIVSNLSYEVVVQNSKLMKHYVGLTSSQFKILYEFLDDICPLKLITFWSFSKNN